jgi:hypothetical protein
MDWIVMAEDSISDTGCCKLGIETDFYKILRVSCIDNFLKNDS